MRFDPSRAHIALLALTDFARLNRLDDVWTSYLREPGPVPPEHAAMLASLTEEMGNLLEGFIGHAMRLQGLVDERRDDVNRAFVNTVAAAPLSPGQRSAIEQVIREQGGFAQFAISQLTVLYDESLGEAQQLRIKMTVIRERGISAGDLTFRFKCALGLALLAASIALLVSTGTILLPTVIAAVQGGAGPAAVVAAFAAHDVAGVLLEATHAVVGVAHLIENGCFRR